MRATYAGTDITLTSEYLDDVSDVDTLVLTAKINCCDTEYTLTLDVGDVADGAIVVDGLELFGEDEELSDAIFSFTLTITYDDGTVRKPKGCLFYNEATSCLVAEYVEEKEDLELQMDLFLLSEAYKCGCECTSFCGILERVLKKLGVIDCDLCDSTTTVNCSTC